MTIAAEIIAQAHVQLAWKGWTNDVSKMRNEGPRCVGLAVADVSWAKLSQPMAADDNPRRFLVEAIREREPKLADVEDKALIITWNDHYCAGLDDALAVLKRAEELARA